jgi:LPPG:FO 2-phospho-L-lactate transferase
VKVALLSGGVGGSRFALALAESLPAEDLTVIVNVGDDLDVLGLRVCPDLDSVVYRLAGLADDERGWGRSGETWKALETVRSLGGESWFALGDSDLGLHLVRTVALRAGEPLSAVTSRVARALGVEAAVLPATDDRLETWVSTPAGRFPFEEWFVARGHRDPVDGIEVRGAGAARPAAGVLDGLREADAILIAPSNPYVSVGPILAVPGIRAALESRTAPCVAVSPLIGGRAVKGPADAMLARLEGGTSPAHVAGCYRGLIDALVLDERDAGGAGAVAALGVRPVVARTLMRDEGARRALVEAALGVAAPAR